MTAEPGPGGTPEQVGEPAAGASEPAATGGTNRTVSAPGQSTDSGYPDSPDSSTDPVSGLKNPALAILVVGTATLVLEWIALLLAIQPIRIIAPDTPGWALGVIAALAFACLGVAGLLRRPWAWHAGTGLQLAVIAAGVFQYSMFVLGAVFLALWLYALKVRSDLSKPARFDH